MIISIKPTFLKISPYIDILFPHFGPLPDCAEGRQVHQLNQMLEQAAYVDMVQHEIRNQYRSRDVEKAPWVVIVV